MLKVEPPPLLPKTAILCQPVGVRVSTTTENLRRLKRVEKCGAVEQARVSRRAEHARAIYQGRDNYRALTCPTRSAFGDHGWAPCAPARPEALLAVQTVHLAHIGEYLVSHSHYVTTASTWLTRRPWFNERCGVTLTVSAEVHKPLLQQCTKPLPRHEFRAWGCKARVRG